MLTPWLQVIRAVKGGGCLSLLNNLLDDVPGEIATERPDEIARTSASPALLTLSALVNGSTMITPPSTPRTPSIASSARLYRTRGNTET